MTRFGRYLIEPTWRYLERDSKRTVTFLHDILLLPKDPLSLFPWVCPMAKKSVKNIWCPREKERKKERKIY